MKRTFVLLAFASMAGACDLPSAEEVRDAVETEVFQALECEELARPSTLARMRAALDHPSAETFAALATDPADLATVVSFAGAEVEGVMFAANNINSVASSGIVQDLLTDGWDAIGCGDALPLGCTAGEQKTVVLCDPYGDAKTIDLTFARCTLHGTVLDGALTLARKPKDELHASLEFRGFSIDEVKVLDGGALLDLEDDGAFSAALADRGFSFLEHGGVDGGLECGATLAVDALAIDLDSDGGTVKLAGIRETAEDKLAIRTLGDDIRFERDEACACPLPGSGLYVDVPRPLGDAGAVAGATITWGAAADDASCASAAVELSDWPADCLMGGDCAKGVTEDVLSGLMTALCTRP